MIRPALRKWLPALSASRKLSNEIRIGFTPDEEVGHGVDYFDVKRLLRFAYTLDGGEIGELQYENLMQPLPQLFMVEMSPGKAKADANAILGATI